MATEEEWIESPDGWGEKKEGNDNHANNGTEEEEEGAGAFGFFEDNDPKDCFTFDIKIPAENEDNGNGDGGTVTTKSLRLSGFKLDSEETAKSTGVTLWQAAPRLATYLLQAKAAKEHIVGRQILELGAGLGLCGIVAHHVGARHVILSDGDTQALEQMRQNVAQNCVMGDDESSKTATIECRQLIWGSSAHLSLFQESYGLFDTILGADVIYTRESLDPLLDTVVSLLKKPTGQFVLSRYTRWNDVSDEIVLEAASTRNLVCVQPDEGIYVFSFQRNE